MPATGKKVEQILDAAVEEFQQRGFAGAGMDLYVGGVGGKCRRYHGMDVLVGPDRWHTQAVTVELPPSRHQCHPRQPPRHRHQYLSGR